MGDPATKEDVQQIVRTEIGTLREDVIRPMQRDVQRLNREIYGEFGNNGLRTKVKENTTTRRHVRWIWGSFVAAVITAGVTWLFSGIGGG